MENALKAPLFIFGYPRSGTTLLRALLGAHSQVSLVNEPELVWGMRSAGFKTADRLKPGEYAGFLEKIKATRMCRRHLATLPPEVLSSFVDQKVNSSFREIYEFLLPKATGVAIWGEKSLGNTFYIRELSALYPNAIFVHIVRDPKATLLSHYRKSFTRSVASHMAFESKSIRFFAFGAMRWRKWLAAAEQASSRLDKSSFIRIRFEDLISQPKRELGNICRSLGVEFEEEMLDAAHRKEDPAIADSNSAYAHTNLNKPIDPSRAETHRELPDWARYVIDQYVQQDLEPLGYSQDCPSISPYMRLRIEAELYISKRKLRAKLQKEMHRRQAADRWHMNENGSNNKRAIAARADDNHKAIFPTSNDGERRSSLLSDRTQPN